jgi:hypothetical protein
MGSLVPNLRPGNKLEVASALVPSGTLFDLAPSQLFHKYRSAVDIGDKVDRESQLCTVPFDFDTEHMPGLCGIDMVYSRLREVQFQSRNSGYGVRRRS